MNRDENMDKALKQLIRMRVQTAMRASQMVALANNADDPELSPQKRRKAKTEAGTAKSKFMADEAETARLNQEFIDRYKLSAEEINKKVQGPEFKMSKDEQRAISEEATGKSLTLEEWLLEAQRSIPLRGKGGTA